MKCKTAATVLALIVVLAAALTPSAGASGDPVGTAALLEIGLSARALGMGGVGIALADDANTIYHNPGGLGLVDGNHVCALYTEQFGAAGYMSAGFAGSHFGADILRLDASGIEAYDPFANLTGVFGVTELAGAIGYGHDVLPWLSLGASGKFYMQTLPENTGKGFTFDVGALAQMLDGRLALGVVGRDLLGSVKYETGSTDPFDRSFGVGVAVRPLDGLLVAADAILGETVVGKFGAEYRWGPVALRAGAQLSEASRCYTAGAGFALHGFTIDYAYQAHNILPDSHRISLGVRF
ncbi:MAG: hypothetical protein BWY85_01209 [Firmicutes bacterium ADurb.Bin506]|jgi:hypothetical protein|nr:MAG: hypothetical protein BWY85_01209 [Firmicutes bacterium ADurb.Bin506]